MSTVTLIILVATLATMAGLVIAPSVRQGRGGDPPVRNLLPEVPSQRDRQRNRQQGRIPRQRLGPTADH